jgi:hypothetical protein
MLLPCFIYKIYIVIISRNRPIESNRSQLMNNFNASNNDNDNQEHPIPDPNDETEKERELKVLFVYSLLSNITLLKTQF